MGKTSRASHRPTEKANSGKTVKGRHKSDTQYENESNPEYKEDREEVISLIRELKDKPLFDEHLGRSIAGITHLSGCEALKRVESMDDIIRLADPCNTSICIGIQHRLIQTITKSDRNYDYDCLKKLLSLLKLINKYYDELKDEKVVIGDTRENDINYGGSSSKGGKTKKSRKSKNKTRRRKNKNISA